MYKCPECGAVFEDPDYTEMYWEDYNGVGSLFADRNTAVFASCPRCGAPIDTECDIYWEEEDDEYE